MNQAFELMKTLNEFMSLLRTNENNVDEKIIIDIIETLDEQLNELNLKVIEMKKTIENNINCNMKPYDGSNIVIPDYLSCDIQEDNFSIINTIEETILKNPLKDGIIGLNFIKFNNHARDEELRKIDLFTFVADNTAISGSFAILSAAKFFNISIDWKANDIDIYKLGCENNNRLKLNGNLDLNHIKNDTVDNFVLERDLPICRVAIHKKYIYVSIQFLYSLLTKKLNLPLYLKDKKSLKEKLENKMDYEDIEKLWNSYNKRIQKYIDRGYTPQYYKTNDLIAFIENVGGNAGENSYY